jgi:uncharacterized membrane protein YfhO
MRLHHGWKAYVDDQQVNYTAYLDILPAIPVSGPAHVIFKYEPKSFRRGATVSLIGVCMLLVFSGLCLRKPKERGGPSAGSG